MQGGLTEAQQQTLALKGLAAALHRGALVDGNTISASFQAAYRCLHSSQVHLVTASSDADSTSRRCYSGTIPDVCTPCATLLECGTDASRQSEISTPRSPVM